MRDITPQILKQGATIAVVGSGSPKQAKAFAAERDLPFALYTDPGLRAYAAAGLRRDVASTLNPKLLTNAVRALRGGNIQGRTQGDPWQQGGAFVIDHDGSVLLRQVSTGAGDHVDPQTLVDALPR